MGSQSDPIHALCRSLVPISHGEKMKIVAVKMTAVIGFFAEFTSALI